MRRSECIKPRQASKFFKAARHSQDSTRPLNLHITINLAHTSCPPDEAACAMTAIAAKFTRWLRHQSKKAQERGATGYGPPTYQAVVENPNGIHHAHWLVHVPDELLELFGKMLPKWIAKVVGRVDREEGLVKLGPIETVMALSRYCMKGVDPRHARRCFVKHKPQGTVWGKRVSISRSLGQKAREAAASAASRASQPRPAHGQHGTGAEHQVNAEASSA